jgi:hypothetical protein
VLVNNTTGSNNTATGTGALINNSTAGNNTANGYAALGGNIKGLGNTATGSMALNSNTTGFHNTATGTDALYSNTTSGGNTADGRRALFSNTGGGNTAVGFQALSNNTTGNRNIALGGSASINLSTGSDNIDIGNIGRSAESGTIRIGTVGTHTNTFIAGISGTAVVGDSVVVAGNGQLGTVASAARFKKEIRPMDKTSEAILALKPVSFQYKSDSKGTPQFGLVAEEVAKVNPDLVVRDRNGEIYSVRYEAVNAMLLNEFLKEHKKTEKLEATVASLITTAKEQALQIEKVSAQLEASKPAPQVVNNNQ